VPKTVVLDILSSMLDPTTLHDFTIAYSRFTLLYHTTYRKVRANMLHQCRALQLQRLIHAIISVRSSSTFTENTGFTGYFDTHLEERQIPLIVDSILDAQHVPHALQNLARTSASFLRTRVSTNGGQTYR